MHILDKSFDTYLAEHGKENFDELSWKERNLTSSAFFLEALIAFRDNRKQNRMHELAFDMLPAIEFSLRDRRFLMTFNDYHGYRLQTAGVTFTETYEQMHKKTKEITERVMNEGIARYEEELR